MIFYFENGDVEQLRVGCATTGRKVVSVGIESRDIAALCTPQGQEWMMCAVYTKFGNPK